MKKLILIYQLLLIVSCSSPQGDKIVKTGKGYVIKTIDSCEYIEVDEGLVDQRIYSLTHKGNCNNSIHKK